MSANHIFHWTCFSTHPTTCHIIILFYYTHFEINIFNGHTSYYIITHTHTHTEWKNTIYCESVHFNWLAFKWLFQQKIILYKIKTVSQWASVVSYRVNLGRIAFLHVLFCTYYTIVQVQVHGESYGLVCCVIRAGHSLLYECRSQLCHAITDNFLQSLVRFVAHVRRH